MTHFKSFNEWLNENEKPSQEEFVKNLTEASISVDKLLPKKLYNMENIRCRMVNADWGYDSGSPSGDYPKAVIMATVTKKIVRPFKKTEVKTWNTLLGTLCDVNYYVPAKTPSDSSTEWKETVKQCVMAVIEALPGIEIDEPYVENSEWFSTKYPDYLKDQPARGSITAKRLGIV